MSAIMPTSFDDPRDTASFFLDRIITSADLVHQEADSAFLLVRLDAELFERLCLWWSGEET